MTAPKKPRAKTVVLERDDRLAELEAKYVQALATIQQLSTNNAVLSAQVGSTMRAPILSGQLVVGIRNVSNYTIGLTDSTTGQDMVFTLHPEIQGVADPKTKAVVSYVFWQQLRTGNYVARGLIIRDDSVLGPADNAAPPDRAEDVHPDAARNVVLDPRKWILEKSEEDLREAINAMTSEPTLRRLIEAVDTEVWNIGETKYKDDPDKARKAVRDLPASFRIAEELFYERLDELNPYAKGRDQETVSPRRYTRA